MYSTIVQPTHNRGSDVREDARYGDEAEPRRDQDEFKNRNSGSSIFKPKWEYIPILAPPGRRQIVPLWTEVTPVYLFLVPVFGPHRAWNCTLHMVVPTMIPNAYPSVTDTKIATAKIGAPGRCYSLNFMLMLSTSLHLPLCHVRLRLPLAGGVSASLPFAFDSLSSSCDGFMSQR